MRLKFIVLAVSILGIVSCYKTPEYPDVPALEFDQYQINGSVYTIGDTGNLLLKFTDGDGDLGTLGGDSTSVVSYINTKADTFFRERYFNIPFIPQKGTSKAISGTIQMKFKDGLFSAYEVYFGTRGKTVDTFAFKMRITDRAGHVSNEIITPLIVVKMP